MTENSRRRFIRNTIIGSAGIATLPLLQSFKTSANDTIRIGFIGLGQQAMNLLNGFSKIKGVQIVAGADVYGIKRKRFEKRLNEFYKDLNSKPDVKTYKDYREIIDRQDIDTVVIASPDHWHALMALDACNAGKDIYLEKPITFSIKESLMLAKAVRRNNVIFATGSQQRSDSNYQHTVNMVHREAFGKLTKVNAYVGPGPVPYDLPEEKIPADLDWKQWLGPMPYVHYNSKLNPPITIDPPTRETFWARWRYYKETGGGFTCDWGAHNFDIGQWGLNKDHSGPVKIIPPGYQDTKFLTFVYDNGLEMTNEPYDEHKTLGVKFWGEDGWIEVSRGSIAASNESLLPSKDETEEAGLYERSSLHLENFIEAVRARIDPIVPVEIGQRTVACCILGNVAYELNRPVSWSPEQQYFVNDKEAEKFFHREYQNGYKL
ncbi:MAG: Gfo/Idh/MocA family oxidoreductase [Bacteroidota bacterium]|nr:Gfo/Idh/MocA family oxidoreductase [Bacteroidota bacterium]